MNIKQEEDEIRQLIKERDRLLKSKIENKINQLQSQLRSIPEISSVEQNRMQQLAYMLNDLESIVRQKEGELLNITEKELFVMRSGGLQ